MRRLGERVAFLEGENLDWQSRCEEAMEQTAALEDLIRQKAQEAAKPEARARDRWSFIKVMKNIFGAR